MAGESLLMSNSEYIQNQTKFYSDLLESQELTDVTLACDGYQVGAHRTVISASSLFFRDVIKNSKHQNPFIYLKGVSKETLESMLHFIYAGEATVQSENLEQLVEVGKDLEIIGLMQEEAKALKKNQRNNQRITKTRSVKKEDGIKHNKDRPTEIEQETSKTSDFEKLKNERVNVEDNLDNLSNEINKRILTMTDENNKPVHVCTVCETQSKKKSKLKRHIEIHLEGFSHKCNYCDIVKKTTHNLKAHEWHYHTGPNAKMAQKV